jgi:hypothetical protein
LLENTGKLHAIVRTEREEQWGTIGRMSFVTIDEGEKVAERYRSCYPQYEFEIRG